MRDNIVGRIIGVIVTTFVIAIVYGLFLTTRDFIRPGYDPEVSGHHAADNVYGLFGAVSDEVKRNENEQPTTAYMSVAHKIAMPYALTADLSALLGGKLEVFIGSFISTLKSTPPVHTINLKN